MVDAEVITRWCHLGENVFATTTLLQYAAGATHADILEAMNPFGVSRTIGRPREGSSNEKKPPPTLSCENPTVKPELHLADKY